MIQEYIVLIVNVKTQFQVHNNNISLGFDVHN